MPPNVLEALNRTRNPIDGMRSIALLKKLQTAGKRTDSVRVRIGEDRLEIVGLDNTNE
jgi:hypothetical protein